RMRRVPELDEDRAKGEGYRAGKSERDAPEPVRRGQRRLPRMEPRMPRTISRPAVEPMVRTALLAIASISPCDCLPPRGPVLPNRMSETGLEEGPEVAGALVFSFSEEIFSSVLPLS